MNKFNKVHDYIFRCEPVPKISNKRSRYKYLYKIPKTTQEKRISNGLIVDGYEFLVRGARKPVSFPNPWNDISRSKRGNTWKNTKKKKQWL